jgi:hypothetical protein
MDKIITVWKNNSNLTYNSLPTGSVKMLFLSFSLNNSSGRERNIRALLLKTLEVIMKQKKKMMKMLSCNFGFSEIFSICGINGGDMDTTESFCITG